ncbi:unnamed protein product [Didymodactylos carnosus]|uniref:Multifunctional fusion protein n=1 Tax=Didymodactylos carnosus TaxID=1234261 RepID=A0A814IA89_9BILA|nr:unnamed protein product [Didymodactylos carnosus]CAF1195200.1 unnamed protein product [Didymodactylos carnosus]CAF3792579.1 unnamed protein product [Didymodactylos carnosus]CAF4005481.1 unnamed protein product [Didymodactylos carnosus]
MPSDDHGKLHMIQKCQEYYRGNRKELKLIQEFDETYRRDDAIRWYTKQSFVYKLINKALRTEDIEQLYLFRFFIVDLCSCLAQEYEKMKQREKNVLRVYRGVRLSSDEFEKLKENEGKLISTNGFLSTSRCRALASHFAGESTKQGSAVSVLFEIECDLIGLNDVIVVADIAQFSGFTDEEEVLFDLAATFKILSIHRTELNVYVVKMTATGSGREFAHQYIALNRKELELEERSVVVMFGSLLCGLGQYKKSQKYFQNLQQNPEAEDIAQIQLGLGHAYASDGEYTKALTLHECAYDIMMSTSTVRVKESARVLNNIGAVYFHKGEYDRALEFYERSLKIREKCLPAHHPDIATSLNNIGAVHCLKGVYDRALEYSERSLKIREKCLPADHADIAKSLNNIAGIYFRKGEYDRALKYYERSVKINEKCFAADHPNIAMSLNNIAGIHKGEYDRALEYSERSLKIREKCLPADHTDTAKSLNSIADICSHKGEYVNQSLYN